MNEIITNAFDHLLGRTQGMMWVRLIIQPAIAIFFGVRAGLKNARAKSKSGKDKAAYRTLSLNMLKQGWHDVWTVIIVGTVLDIVYQWFTLGMIYPMETILVVILIVLLPYHITRLVVAKIAEKKSEKNESGKSDNG